MPAHVRSIWLMPNSDDEAFLSSLIRDLAERFGTPVFAPHPTLRSGSKTAPLPSGLDGLSAQLLADAATESARTGKPVAIEAVGR